MFNINKSIDRDSSIRQNPDRVKEISAGVVMTFYYGNGKLDANFYASVEPFTETYNGKARNRKGFVMCVITETYPSVQEITTGYAVCSEKDKWDTSKGMTTAFVDAIQRLSYDQRKECLDKYVGEIWKNGPPKLIPYYLKK